MRFRLPILTGLCALFVFIAPVTQAQSSQQLSLSATETDVKTGATFNVAINAQIPESIMATDVVLTYDASMLEVVKIDPGKLFSQYPGIAQSAATKGTIRISGINDTAQAVTGIIATVNFKAIGPGKAVIAFSFDPEDTTSSGIITETGDNLLNATPTELSLNITGKPIVPADKSAASTSPIKATKKNSTNLLTIVVLILLVLVIGSIVTYMFLKNKNKVTTKPPAPTPIPATNPENSLYGTKNPVATPIPTSEPQPLGMRPTTFPEPTITAQSFPPTGTPPTLPNNHQHIDQIIHEPQPNVPSTTPNPEDKL